MLKLKDKNKKLIAGLINYKDLCIESVLATGDKTLSFSLHKKDKFYNLIEEECYIETKEAEFVVKARDVGVNYTRFDCVLNLEELEANIFDRFESVEQPITASLNLAIVGTGWTVKNNTLKKKRTVRCTNKNALEIVQEIKKTYRVDIVFNTLKKQIEVYEHLGEDKGTYFIDSLNLIALQIQSDSYKFATRIIAEGKDGLTFEDINNGKNYVENYQYSRKVKTIYWKDERYTIKENLLEDARAKLEELSKPFRSYSTSILNLAELNPKYKNILDYQLGDTITLLSKNNKVKDKQRIVKTLEYPQDHSRDTVELANAVLKFEDIQQENQETSDTVSNITTDNGTINGSTIDSITTKQIEDFEANVIKVTKLKAILAEIENLHVNKADIQNLNAVVARIGTLEATKASITELNAIHAIIQQIKAGKADIADLNAAVAKVGILENKTAVLENALAGNLTADNFKTNAITAGSAVIAEGAIGSSQISSLSVNKLEAGDITTSKHKIVSADGTIEIVGNQILINRNNINRVILGEYRKQDNTTEYGLLIRGKDGRTVMFDSDGVHNAGITDGAIDNNKVADNANISGNKLDINSVIREVNNNGTETIKGTKVTVGDRTLDVELSTQNNTITEHSKELSSQKASLTALDNALKFKVDSQTFTQSTTTINNNINRAKEEAINSSNSHADSKANEALNNAKAFVNSEITNVNTHLNKNTSEINILKDQIESKVSQSDIDKSIQNIEFGGRNLFLKSKGPFKSSNEYVGISITSVVEKYLNKKITISADVKANKVGKIRFYSLGGYSVGFWVERDVTTEWTRIKATGKFTLNDEKQKWCDLSFYGTYGSGLFTEVRNVKIELGELASDYTEAPEDTDKLIIDNIKTVTDKISTVESKLTQENNSIKASVQDLNSTTQSITTNVSNINRDLISKINSNLAVAKSFATDIAIAKANLAREQAIASADGKITEEERKRIQQAQENLDTAIARADKAKQDAINAASTDATNKANNALNSAKAFVNAEITTVNNKVHNVESNIDILKNKIALKVEQSDIDKTKTELINKINVVDNLANNAKDLASAMSLGKMLFSDPTFKNSSNNIKTYNNNGNGTVTTSRISKINGCPTDSQYCIEVKTVGSASPNHGGFYFGNMTRANAIFVTKIIAKIPVGLRIGWYSNSTGNNGSSKWLTSVNGTGKWEEYIHLLKCGDTGSFSSTSFFALDGGGTPTSSNPIIWHIAYATVFDITENDESVNVLKTEMSTAKNKVAIIETNLDSITQRISSTESKTHSIETTLGGKASKQEVAEVNNRIATIKANLDSITQRVSNTESKTNSLETNINGKASKQELTVVNNKVTEVTASLNGITQRVGNTESRINALDGKVAGAVTLQQFTEFKQSNDKFKFTVEQRSSVSNILPNSSFHGGDRGWLHGGNEFWSGPYSGYGFKGRITGAIKNRAAYNNPERYLQTHKAYKVKKNTTYTINFHYICEKNVQSMDAFVVLSDTEHGDYAQPICVLTAQGGSQSNATEEKPFTYKFNTGNHEWVWIRFDHNGMKSGVNWDEFCWVYVSEIGIYEGDVGAVKWTPKGGEVYSANYQMDGLGFKGTFEDGTYASLGKDGLEWFNAGTGHAYHALTYVTSFDIPIGNPGKAYIKLPAEFTKRRNSLKWTVALRGYYYSTSGDFFPFHIHCTGGRDYIENGLVVCEVQGYCKIQNAQNAGDVQFRPLTAMLIAIA
ncbi:phage tail protein [Clostridium perfringens]|uniref:phage tail spike protein n=1 Tax=Clostridium perfringens TaxID=1502 RepID=UPI0018E40B38|nr:phage tail spike protein [Clostridium perfringens]MBI6009232.1 phage tail protein [Clostridium perfringens]MCO6001746.1 phage tail protein [Clostridium perfringens]MCO7394623.1 phage tail protein [Clostridium perfringens]MCP8914447.1 phage tail protein [Clostridium perfringens]MCP8964300.1 phage tail protein [Clostridium perfringens]